MAGLFIKLDTNFWSHPKVLAAGEPAAVLYQQMAMYCMDHTTDGHVPDAQLPRFGLPRLRQRLAALADAGMIERVDGGWLVPGYVERYKTAAQVEELGRTRSESGKKGGRPRKQVAKANGNQVAFAEQNPEVEVEGDVEEEPPPPEVTPVLADDGEVVAVADALIAQLGYVDPPPAGPDERRYVARALARGWTTEQLTDLAVEAGARDDVDDVRRYLLGVLRNRANEDPPARPSQPAATAPTSETRDSAWADVRRIAATGSHAWGPDCGLSDRARSAALRARLAIRNDTEANAKWVFFAAWDELAQPTGASA